MILVGANRSSKKGKNASVSPGITHIERRYQQTTTRAELAKYATQYRTCHQIARKKSLMMYLPPVIAELFLQAAEKLVPSSSIMIGIAKSQRRKKNRARNHSCPVHSL